MNHKTKKEVNKTEQKKTFFVTVNNDDVLRFRTKQELEDYLDEESNVDGIYIFECVGEFDATSKVMLEKVKEIEFED